MKSFFLILFLFSTILFASCFRKHCPDFNEELLQWLPYKSGDIINLKNTLLDSTITININNVEIEHMDSYKKNHKCGQCDDYIYVNNYSPSQFYYDANTHYQELESETFNFSINDTTVSFNTSRSQITEKNTYNIEGIEYQNVKIFTNNKSNDKNFYCLILAKDIGIVALIDNNDRYWSINSNNKKTTEFNLKKSDC